MPVNCRQFADIDVCVFYHYSPHNEVGPSIEMSVFVCFIIIAHIMKWVCMSCPFGLLWDHRVLH